MGIRPIQDSEAIDPERQAALDQEIKLHEIEKPVLRRLAKEWAYVPETEKEKWIYEETKDRQRYCHELKYAPRRVSLKPRPKRRGPRIAPKRILTPYMFYVKAVRPKMMRENPEMSFVDIMRTVGRTWTSMNATDKRPYQERNEADKQRFAEEALSFSRMRQG